MIDLSYKKKQDPEEEYSFLIVPGIVYMVCFSAFIALMIVKGLCA